MKNKKNLSFDIVLPLLEPDEHEWYSHVGLLEVKSKEQLMEMAFQPQIGGCLLGRLSDTMALVDPHKEDDLMNALLKHGYLPKKES